MEKVKQVASALAGFWKRSRIPLILAVILVIAVVFIGLHDVGIILGYLATAIVMVELTRRWRKIRYFITLFFASFLGIILLAFLHEEAAIPLAGFFTGAGQPENPAFRLFSDIVSLAMIFIGGMGMVIGIAGTFILGVWRLARMGKKTGTRVKT